MATTYNRPTVQTNVASVLTYADALERLQAFVHGGAFDLNASDAKFAVQDAYQQLCSVRPWRGFYSWGRINTVAAYSTGTLSYDHTGGASERLVTFSTALSSTVQGWAGSGHVLIGDTVYSVEDYKSTTTITLDVNSNPGADVASGTSFTLYRNVYELPPDFRGADDFSPADTWGMTYVSPQEFMQLERINRSAGRPSHWTVMGSPKLYGGLAMFLWPYPSTAETIDFMYHRNPRRLYYSGQEAGTRSGNTTTASTATVSAASASVTVTNGEVASDMLGCIFRFSRNTTAEPTGYGGTNPYKEQCVVKTVGSATGFTADQALTNAFSAVKYTISDPLDLPTLHLQDAFWRLCEALLCRVRAPDRLAGAMVLYDRALMQAKANDFIRLDPGPSYIYRSYWGQGYGDDNDETGAI